MAIHAAINIGHAYYEYHYNTSLSDAYIVIRHYNAEWLHFKNSTQLLSLPVKLSWDLVY